MPPVRPSGLDVCLVVIEEDDFVRLHAEPIWTKR